MGAAARVPAGDAALLTTSAQVDELWEACLARPDDDGTRNVLADLLQIAGDARGELMSLQLLPADPEVAPARRARIRELLGIYGPTWLGPLYELAYGARFERGFVTRVELGRPAWSNTDARWDLDDRELASIQELVFGRSTAPIYARMLGSSKLRSLRSVEVVDQTTLAALETAPARITHVACGFASDSHRSLVEVLMKVVAERPAISSLGIWSDTFETVRRQPWFDRLTSVTVACTARRGLELWRRLPAHVSLAIASSARLDGCERVYPWDMRLELRREGIARVSGEWLLQSLDVLLDLPREITRIEVEDTSEPIADRILRAVAARDIEVSLRGLIGRAGNLRWR